MVYLVVVAYCHNLAHVVVVVKGVYVAAVSHVHHRTAARTRSTRNSNRRMKQLTTLRSSRSSRSPLSQNRSVSYYSPLCQSFSPSTVKPYGASLHRVQRRQYKRKDLVPHSHSRITCTCPAELFVVDSTRQANTKRVIDLPAQLRDLNHLVARALSSGACLYILYLTSFLITYYPSRTLIIQLFPPSSFLHRCIALLARALLLHPVRFQNALPQRAVAAFS